MWGSGPEEREGVVTDGRGPEAPAPEAPGLLPQGRGAGRSES